MNILRVVNSRVDVSKGLDLEMKSVNEISDKISRMSY